MGVIYLVRHGQADPSAYGVPSPLTEGVGALTPRGAQQARRAGAALRRRTDTVTAAITGDLPRQRQTLTHILRFFNEPPPVIVDSNWNEYPMPASVDGIDSTGFDDARSYQQRLDQGLSDWITGHGAHTDAESFIAYSSRVTAAAARAEALAGPGRTVVIASSAGTISRLVATAWGVPDSHWPALARTMVNSSITTLIVGRRGTSVVAVNEHAHLFTRAEDLRTFR